MMIHGYNQLCMVDSGVFDTEKTGARLRQEASRWGLEYTERPGSKRILEKLLSGDWNSEEFCRIGPDRTVEYRDFEGRVPCVE